MIDASCAICGSEDRRPLHDVRLWDEPVRIVRCGSCGHVFRSPRPEEQEADGYYDEAYYRGEGDYGYEDEREHEEIARARARPRLRRMERALPGTGRLIEVGCSFGIFLDEARRCGWDPVGVDVSPYAANHAREAFGLDVRLGRVEEVEAPDGSFDAAYLSETIEHLADPMRTLRRLADLLREGGLLVVGTGNVSSLAARLRGRRWGYFMPGHLQLFSIASLRRALRTAGFRDVRIHVPDDRGIRGAREIAAADGRSQLRAAIAWLARAPRIGSLALGAGFVAYARKAPA